MGEMDRRRTFKDFPQVYFDVLEMLKENPSQEVTYHMQHRDAHSRRRDFYRFRRALDMEAAFDPYAKELSDFARDLIIRLDPARAEKEDPTDLVFFMNPMSPRSQRPQRLVDEMVKKE